MIISRLRAGPMAKLRRSRSLDDEDDDDDGGTAELWPRMRPNRTHLCQYARTRSAHGKRVRLRACFVAVSRWRTHTHTHIVRGPIVPVSAIAYRSGAKRLPRVKLAFSAGVCGSIGSANGSVCYIDCCRDDSPTIVAGRVGSVGFVRFRPMVTASSLPLCHWKCRALVAHSHIHHTTVHAADPLDARHGAHSLACMRITTYAIRKRTQTTCHTQSNDSRVCRAHTQIAATNRMTCQSR